MNTVEEYGAAMTALDAPHDRAAQEIRVQYYALLREQAGRSDETLDDARAHAARAVRRAARAVSVHAARRDAARGRQRRIRRLVAAAAGRRRRGVHSPGGRRMNALLASATTPLDTAALQRELRDDDLRRLRRLRRLGAQSQRRPRGHAPRIRSVRRARREGRRAHRRRSHRAIRRHARRLRASRGFARASATSPCGWA